jgi:hypothetical protein
MSSLALVDSHHPFQQAKIVAALLGYGAQRLQVLGEAGATVPDTWLQVLASDALSLPMPSRTSSTSAPLASHISAIALANEIFIARNALAACLMSSALAEPVITRRAGMCALSGTGIALLEVAQLRLSSGFYVLVSRSAVWQQLLPRTILSG